MKDGRGFTRADVMVTGAVLLVLGMLVPAVLAQARKGNARQVCAANLRNIAQSCVVYSNENEDSYPLLPAPSAVKYDATLKPVVGKATKEATIHSLYVDKAWPNNPAASLWLLVLNDQVVPKDFVCPADAFGAKPAKVQKDDKGFYQNFQDGRNLSYSMAYPWMDSSKGTVGGGWWKNTTDSSLPILADMAPYLSSKAEKGEATSPPAASAATGTATAPASAPAEKFEGEWSLKTALSANHNFAGMNVVFADAHTEFVRRPDIGQANDNIWAETVDKKEVAIDAGLLPAKLTATFAPFDIVMVPTRDAKGNLK